MPVLYQVDRIRDGRSFTVRSVKAIQHGQPILICQASFQVLQPSPLQHQFSMPVVPQPEDLLTVEELIQRYLRYSCFLMELLWVSLKDDQLIQIFLLRTRNSSGQN